MGVYIQCRKYMLICYIHTLMYADVNMKSPETMRRKTPIAMVTPVGKAEGVEADNVSVGLMVSMFVVGTLIPNVAVILGSVTKEPKFQQR